MRVQVAAAIAKAAAARFVQDDVDDGYRRPSPADAGDHGGAWLLPFPVWLQFGGRATLRSFLVDLFVPKIKLRERERERVPSYSIRVILCMKGRWRIGPDLPLYHVPS